MRIEAEVAKNSISPSDRYGAAGGLKDSPSAIGVEIAWLSTVVIDGKERLSRSFTMLSPMMRVLRGKRRRRVGPGGEEWRGQRGKMRRWPRQPHVGDRLLGRSG